MPDDDIARSRAPSIFITRRRTSGFFLSVSNRYSRFDSTRVTLRQIESMPIYPPILYDRVLERVQTKKNPSVSMSSAPVVAPRISPPSTCIGRAFHSRGTTSVARGSSRLLRRAAPLMVDDERRPLVPSCHLTSSSPVVFTFQQRVAPPSRAGLPTLASRAGFREDGTSAFHEPTGPEPNICASSPVSERLTSPFFFEQREPLTRDSW